MRLLIHQALKDARVVRWLALLWLLLSVLFQALTVRLAYVPAGQDRILTTLVYAYSGMQAMLVALFVVIAVIIVQNDPAVGTTAFWFTRPIPVSVLLGSKFLLTLTLLVVVPIVTDVVAVTAGGLSFHDALGTVPGSLVTDVAWLLPLLAVAALTVNLAQFVFAALIEVLVFYVSLFAWRGLIGRHANLGDMPSTAVLTMVLIAGLVALGLGSLVYAYRVRTLRRAAVVTGAAPIAIVLLVMGWPWSFSTLDRRITSSPMTASVAPGSLMLQAARQGDWRLGGAIRFSNVPPARIVSIASVRAWIEYPHERVDLQAWPAESHREPDGPGSRQRALKQALGAKQLGGTVAEPTPGFAAWVAKDVYDRRPSETGTFHADLRVTVYEQLAAAVEARAGAEYRIEGHTGRILTVTAAPDALSVEVWQTWIKPGVITRSPSEETSLACAVRNSRFGLAVSPTESRGSQNLPPTQLPIPVPAHLSASWITFEFPWPENVSSADWLRGAEFVALESRTLGDATLHVTIPNLMLTSLRWSARPLPR